MSQLRERRQWSAWVDDILAYEPLAELEPEWQAAIGDAITRCLDERAGLTELAKCERCGGLLTLHCTIRGCGLPPMSLRWRLAARWRR